jgi:hypothetical protein
MNPRERILAIGVAGILVVAGLASLVRWGVVQRWQRLHSGLAGAKLEQTKLAAQLADARGAEQRWGALQPLAHNSDVAAHRLREDMNRLVDQHGLAEKVTIRMLPERRLKNGFTEVRMSIQTRGTLRQVLDFMCDFYRRQYLVRLDQVSLTAEEQGRRGRPGARLVRAPGSPRGSSPAEVRPAAADPDGPGLNVNMLVVALVLPNAEIDLGTGRRAVPQDAIAQTEPPAGALGRLPRPREEYDLVLAQNVMKEWQKPEAVAISTPPTTREAPTPVPLPHAPPRPNKKLVSVSSTHGRLEARIRDEDHKELPLELATINDPVDDGVLVLVYPRGMVVQVPPANGEGDYKYYVYKLGDTFANRVELDPEQYPDLAEQLELALGS